MSSPKVLFISNRRDFSGGEICLERILKKLTNDFLVLLPEGDFSKRLISQNFNVITENNISKLARAEGKLSFIEVFSKIPTLIRIIRDIIKKENIDLIVCNGPACMPYAGLAGKLSKKKVIWIHHHPVLIPGTLDFFLMPIIAKFAHKIISVSNWVTESLVKSGIPSKKIITIHNGLDYVHFNPVKYEKGFLRKRYGLSSRAVLLGLIATINRWKGFHIAIQAMELLKKDVTIKAPYHLFLIGDVFENSTIGQNYKNDLTHLINSKNLKNDITFTGKFLDLLPTYKDLDVVLNCSIVPEPLGATIVEGMAMEKIVVAPNVGGPSEIVQNKISGFLIPPNDPHLLYQTLKMIISDTSLLENLKQSARDNVIKNFGIDNITKKYEKVFFETFSGIT